MSCVDDSIVFKVTLQGVHDKGKTIFQHVIYWKNKYRVKAEPKKEISDDEDDL